MGGKLPARDPRSRDRTQRTSPPAPDARLRELPSRRPNSRWPQQRHAQSQTDRAKAILGSNRNLDGAFGRTASSVSWGKGSMKVWRDGYQRGRTTDDDRLWDVKGRCPLLGHLLMILVRGFALGGAIELQDRIDTDFPYA